MQLDMEFVELPEADPDLVRPLQDEPEGFEQGALGGTGLALQKCHSLIISPAGGIWQIF